VTSGLKPEAFLSPLFAYGQRIRVWTMREGTMDIERNERQPVRFRVQAVFPDPFPTPDAEVVIRIEAVDRPCRRAFSIPTSAYLPYQQAIEAAVSTRAEYCIPGEAWTAREVPAPLDPGTVRHVLAAVGGRHPAVSDFAVAGR
jgi:hypothetical protein